MSDTLHYEAAFEDALRAHRWPYVRVAEQRRSLFSTSAVKSFDFLVHRPGGGGWLADVKGRKFPYDLAGGRHFWENWVTDEDVTGLSAWEGVFGDRFVGTFVFAYWITVPAPASALLGPFHAFRGREYAFLAVSARVYGEHARRRSASWATASMPTRLFRQSVVPVFGHAQSALPAAG